MSGSRDINDLIFGTQEVFEEHEVDETGRETDPQDSPDAAKTWTEPSLYVRIFERAINDTKAERRLFPDEDWGLLEAAANLEYHARFILVRLLHRKPGRWYRPVDLRKYVSEVGQDGISDAFEKLCGPLRPAPQPADDGIIDLTGDSDDEDAQPVAGPSKLPMNAANTDDSQVSLEYLCQDETHLSLSEGLNLLPLDDLKRICKIMKVAMTRLKKDEIIVALMNTASTQSVLTFGTPNSKGKGKQRESGLRQTILPFAASKVGQAQTDRLRQLMLKTLGGKAIKVNPYIHTLILRVHIIWLRSTEIPESLFGPALMSGFKKIVYPSYEHARDPDIWSTREEYLAYETALQLEATIDDLLKPEPKPGRAKPSHYNAFPRFTPGTPGLDLIRKLSTPARTPGIPDDAARPQEEDDTLESGVVGDTSAQVNARKVKKIFEECVVGKYKELLGTDSERAATRKPGLERFEPGYVYTRIVWKCAQALATLKEYAYEFELLQMLLGQRLWRRGRRGKWYERRALIQNQYLCKDVDRRIDMDVLRDAREGVIEALADDDTVLVVRPALIHRLHGLEKRLKLSPEEKAKHEDVTLKKPEEVTVAAVRVWDHPDSIKLDAMGKVKGKENKATDNPITNFFDTPIRTPGTAMQEVPEKKPKPSWTGKSLWQGKEEVVSVEIRALEDYEGRGFKGFHSETQILTTLFALLFWDIIFAKVPGAFETPWQMGPLDIAEDSFYYARQQMIENRLAEIRSGKAPSILVDNDERHREQKTRCIGVSWDMCGREDLVEIAECMGGDVLASICQLFCEDYGGRHSGVPDLIVWNPDTKECKFVEVKGPGDKLQDNQKLWSHALLTFQCQVEVCHVVDAAAPEKKKAKQEAKTPKTPKPRARRAAAASGSRTKGKARANSPSVGSDSEDEEGFLPGMPMEDDEAWVPSTEHRDMPPPRRRKRHRHTVDDDELPIFVPDDEQQNLRTGLEKGDEGASPSSSKRRKTI